MPVRPACPQPDPRRDIFWPDVRPDDDITQPVTYMQDYNVAIPPNFEELPPEEQARLKAQYRYGGIKLRPDIDETIPLNRRTMGLP